LTTLHDLLARHPGQQKTAAVLIDLTTLLRVEPVDNLVLQQALALGWRDFEDAVQAVTAAQCQADYLVTRNPRDFRQSLVPVVTPSEFLALRN
ncbi:MAG: PIN domain-containing protein, partial [Thiobacillus sp.]|nr:PIN domain-containing protein [Thiobacillus sp.]